jgi:chemotaxis protein methyltransferase CheR
MPNTLTLSDSEFEVLRKLLYEAVGINLTPEKKALVMGRLSKRIGDLGLNSFGDYFRRIAGLDPEERQWAFNALSTNETSFFREPEHFRFLVDEILPHVQRSQTFRVWSAASSSGEEAYSIAMVLAEHLGENGWEIIGSDISTKVLGLAQRGLYPMDRTKTIPKPYLRAYCMKGTGPHEGAFLIDASLRKRVNFLQANLIGPLPQVGQFDLIFLRNVLIYFDPPTKRKVVDNLLPFLRPGGYFFSGHSESLTGMVGGLRGVKPAIYRKPA